MKKFFSLIIILLYQAPLCFSQVISVANDRENIVTVGLDNPLTIAVENFTAKSIIAKTDNGKLSGGNGIYILNPVNTGIATITLFKKVDGKLKVIGKRMFRAKLLWDPVFKIGSGKRSISKAELAAQQYVRAELEGSDFSLIFSVDSFKVCIIFSDTCRYIEKLNIGNKISEEVNKEFKMVHKNDTIIFKDIFCTGPGGQRKIEPVIVFISE